MITEEEAFSGSVHEGLKSLLLIMIVWLAGCAGHGKGSLLSDFVVTNTRGPLLFYFTVNNCFTPEMSNAMRAVLRPLSLFLSSSV